MNGVEFVKTVNNITNRNMLTIKENKIPELCGEHFDFGGLNRLLYTIDRCDKNYFYTYFDVLRVVKRIQETI